MSKDPVRLRDQADQAPDLRVDLGRPIVAPAAAYDVARGLARFDANLRAASPPELAAGRAGSAARPLAAYRVAGAGAAGAVVAGLVAWLALGGSPPSAPPSPSPSVPSEAPLRPASTEKSTTPLMAPAEQVAAPALGAGAEPQASPRARRRGATAPDDRLNREIMLLAEARRAAEQSPLRALALADRGEREFPQGVLREEREWIAISALAQTGRVAAARARGQSFLLRYPKGPFSDRVQRMTHD